MHDDHLADNPPNPEELSGPLGRAVEQVRQEPVPQEALDRSLDRAQRLDTPRVVRWRNRRPLLAVAGMAALLLIGLGVWYGLQRRNADKDRNPLALNTLTNGPRSEAPPQAGERQIESIKADQKDRLDLRAPAPKEQPAADSNNPTNFSADRIGRPRMPVSDSPVPLSEPAPHPTDHPVPHPTRAPGAVAGDRYRDDPDGSTRGLSNPNGLQTESLPRLREEGGKDAEEFKKNITYNRNLPLEPREKAAEELGTKGQGKGEGDNKGKDGKDHPKKPQVYHAAARRPTFARVYVGAGNSLELVSLQVNVTIEGPRARTVVDHIFHNPHDRQLEGTFEYPLPTGASPSYFAMFIGQTRDTLPARFARRGDTPPLPQDALARLTPAELVKQVSATDWGTLQEARVVSRVKALETYEDIVRGRIDPALLEYAGGNTFSGRVFPIPPKGYNRVLIAYEELLPCTGDQVSYHYPLPDCKLADLQFNLDASAADCQDAAINIKEVKKEEGGGRLSYHHTWKDNGPGGEAQFTFVPPQQHVQVISGRQNESGPIYLYARLRPELKTENAQPFGEHAVFLLDTSLSEHPDGFARNMKLLRKILETDAGIKHFNILAFNVGASWLEPGAWLDNTQAGRDQAFARLDGTVLEGATDLSAALGQLVKPSLKTGPDMPVNVFLLSDGQITWGESDVNTLVARFEARCPFPTRFHCYRTGLGADNLELFEALTRKGGGIFNCFSDDVTAAAGAHRKQCFQIERVRLVGGPSASDVLVAGRKAAVYPDGGLIVTARVNGTGSVTALLEGTFQGKPMVQEYPLQVNGTGELAPRGWAEVAVASLLALNDSKLDSLVTAYCQQFNIASRVASFLVLENENEYKRLNLEEERGKTVPGGDVGLFVEAAWKGLGKVVSGRESFERFLAQVDPRVKLTAGANGEHVKKLLALLADQDFELPEAPLGGALVRRADVPPAYLRGRDANRGDVNVYIAEARRRLDAKDADGAVRVLSSVIEEYPTRGDALRLVGYRLLDLKQPVQAVRLFRQVQQQRPFEPHSYLDLARSLEECGLYGLAAVQYEVVLAGTWHARFHESIKVVAQEEYLRMMRQAVNRNTLTNKVAEHFGERVERMAGTKSQSDLRVTISWNTDNTDVDLWVVEPDGTKCFYQHNRTKNGGELSQDQTQGYGPERYQIKKAIPGEYTVYVHYFRANPNLLAGESHVNVVITRNADTPREQVERRTVILKQPNEAVEVCKVKF